MPAEALTAFSTCIAWVCEPEANRIFTLDSHRVFPLSASLLARISPRQAAICGYHRIFCLFPQTCAAFFVHVCCRVPPRDAWIEISFVLTVDKDYTGRVPPRDAWIEIDFERRTQHVNQVASPRGTRGLKSCGRAANYGSIIGRVPPRDAWIEIRSA